MCDSRISPLEFHPVHQKLQKFFSQYLGAIQVWSNPFDVLATCEDSTTLTTFNYAGKIWGKQQTAQMDLERELLTNFTKTYPGGIYSITQSWREEKNPIKGRHDLQFPMFEYESHGNINDLKKLVTELLLDLGYKGPFPERTYEEMCRNYNTTTIEHEHEQQIYKDYGPVFFLTDFPEYTNPFWNMKRDQDTGVAKKMDVLLSGVETIGSAERSCSIKQMEDSFVSISDGIYSKTLIEKFGKDRIMNSLHSYLSLPFTPRYGLGIGITRLIRSMKMEGLLTLC